MKISPSSIKGANGITLLNFEFLKIKMKVEKQAEITKAIPNPSSPNGKLIQDSAAPIKPANFTSPIPSPFGLTRWMQKKIATEDIPPKSAKKNCDICCSTRLTESITTKVADNPGNKMRFGIRSSLKSIKVM